MTNRSALKIIDMRMGRLTAACAILARGGNPRNSDRFFEELDQLTMIRDELAKIATRAIKRADSDLESLRREMELAARKIAATRFDDPERQDVLNEFTRLAMIADSLDRGER